MAPATDTPAEPAEAAQAATGDQTQPPGAGDEGERDLSLEHVVTDNRRVVNLAIADRVKPSGLERPTYTRDDLKWLDWTPRGWSVGPYPGMSARTEYLIAAVILWVAIWISSAATLDESAFDDMIPILGGGTFFFVVIVPAGVFRGSRE